MTDQKLRSLVTEAVCLDRDIADKQARLKEIKESLTTEADTRADEATATEGGGTSLIFDGADGCVARVTTAGATLKATIKGEGKDIEKVRTAAGTVFQRLFTPVLAYKPIEGFRDEAVALLGAADGRKLIKLCTNPGKTTVSFETKELTEA